MTILSTFGGGSVSVDTGDIGHSLRFRSGAGAYLSRTFGTPTAQNTWTLSFWVKQAGSISTAAAGGVFMRKVDTQNFESIAFDPNAGSDTNKLGSFTRTTSGTNNRRASSDAVYRDPTAWHNVVVAKSVSQSSSAPTFYVNGVSISVPTRSSAGTPQDFINSAAAHIIGQDAQSTTTSDFYLARICFVDGTALTPSSFGYLNTEINEWVSKSQSAVKAVVDAGGTNSFMLDFDDATSLTTLGYDKSSKGNNWTLNNFSLTAGTSYDWMLDVPGNSFATFNPLYAHPTGNINTLSRGNLQNDTPNSTGNAHKMWGYASQIVTTGKWVVEVTNLTNFGVGICRNVNANTSGTGLDNAIRITTGAAPTVSDGASGTVSGTVPATSGTDVISLEFDVDAASLTVYRNGTSVATVTGITYSATARDSGGWLFISGPATSTATGVSNINFGQYPFTSTATYDSASGGYFHHTPTTGYKALCQRNMSDPAILNPEKHFDVLLHSGNTSTQNVTGAQFQPDLAWIKSRNTNYWNFLYDSVRGATKALVSNSTNAEATYAAGLTGFLSNGISLGNQLDVNGSTYTYVDWLWKAGGAAVTNNAGTVSAQVSANVNAGFSIATFASPAAGDFSIGHGLSTAPGLVIAKATNGNTFNWAVFHVGVCTNGQFLRLNTTDAKQTPGGNVWGAAIPSATLVNLTATGAVEASKNCVVYSFAEIPGFSKIFSYTGNGAADGPFVHCGFKPKYVLIKRVDAAATWCVIDGVRNPSNVENLRLYPAAAAAEETNTYLDATSNGFKVRVDSAEPTMNASGGTYIGIAFADVPAKYSLAR